jgi:GT2 family glycosyltransferase
MRLAIGIATRGRPAILAETIADIEQQRRRPDSIVVSYADAKDIGDAAERFPYVRFIQSAAGLTRQRNLILDELEGYDIVTFLDDDFYMHREHLSLVEQVFVSNPSVAVATGKVLADGAQGPGLTASDAKRIIAKRRDSRRKRKLTFRFNAYGCNMSLRMKPIRDHQLRFDENLPLYGWYEDVEFSRQLAAYGKVVRIEDAYGVHLGAKSGRQSGLRLGYSQVANPFYLARKCSVSWLYAVASMTSRSMKNLVLSVKPEYYVDRRGRLRGNLRAWRDMWSGSISPTRILDL